MNSSTTFRLVWTDAHFPNDYSAKTYEVLGSRESVWHLWYTLTCRSKLMTEPAVYSLDGRKLNPSEGINALFGLNEYLPFKPKEEESK